MIQCACSCATELSRMTTGNAAMRGVLEDLRVIDLRHDVTGPYGRQILGDMGTEVTRSSVPARVTIRVHGSARPWGDKSWTFLR